jgi:hypothetical protein
MYEVLVTFLDAMLAPHDFPELASRGARNWDAETKKKTAQELKASLSSFQNNYSYIHYYQECV